MGFDKKSVSIARFIVDGSRPSNDEIRSILKQHAFIPDLESPDMPITGCVGVTDITDTSFAFDPILDEWIVFGIRSDTKSVPKALCKIKTKEACQAEIAAGKSVSRERRKEIAEEVEAKLKMKALPNPSMKCVAWNTRTQEVWFEGTATKQQDEFMEFFQKTFNRTLEPVSLSSRAMRLFPDKEEAITQFQPSFPAKGAALVPCDEALSEDFLLWLWFGSSHDGLHASDQTDTAFTIAVDNAMSLANAFSRVSYSSDDETEDFDEVRQSFQEYGRALKSLSLLYTDPEDKVWKSTLGSGELTPRSIKKPAIKGSGEDDAEATFILELDSIQTVLSLTDSLFEQFLHVRLSDDWKPLADRIQEWIGQKD